VPNIETQNNVTTGVVIFEPRYEESILIVAGAGTILAGTVLGRITASGKLTPYDSAAVDGSEVAIAVIQNEQVFTGAGEVAINAIIAGEVRLSKLSVYNSGTPLALTQAEVDALRDYAILARSSTELSEFDNQ
jgi:hypothetical protein